MLVDFERAPLETSTASNQDLSITLASECDITLEWYRTTVALYGLTASKGITKCIINLLHDIRICLWVLFLGRSLINILGDYLSLEETKY